MGKELLERLTDEQIEDISGARGSGGHGNLVHQPIVICPKCGCHFDIRANKIHEEEGTIEWKCYHCNHVWKEVMSSEVKYLSGLEK